MHRDTFTWFPGGPPLTYIPLPVSDPERPWAGGKDSADCTEFCAGHYLTPEKLPLESHSGILPPSTQI